MVRTWSCKKFVISNFIDLQVIGERLSGSRGFQSRSRERGLGLALRVDLGAVESGAPELSEDVGGDADEVGGVLSEEALEELDGLLLAEALAGDDGGHGSAAGGGDLAAAAGAEGGLEVGNSRLELGLGLVGGDARADGGGLVPM